MKKLVSMLLAVCMCLSVSAMLTACDEEHTHTYKTEWSKDTTHHWHDCEGEDCTDVADKAEHTWNEGTITTVPTAEANGEKTFTCTVCNAVKGEPVEFTGISEEKWNAMLSPELFTNYTLSYGGIVTQTHSHGVTVTEQSNVVKFTADKVNVYSSISYPNAEEPAHIMDQTFTGEAALQMKTQFETIFLALLAEYENFEYNPANKIYELPAPVEVTVDFGEPTIINMSDGKVSVSGDGKLLTFICDYSQTNGQYGVRSELTFTFSDYGTTVIPKIAE